MTGKKCVAARHGWASDCILDQVGIHVDMAIFKEQAKAILSPKHPNPRIRKVLDLMASTIETPRNLPQLAAAAGLTLRTMARLFEAEIGLSPGKCYQHMRLARARELMLQQGMSVADAAQLCGFSCAAALRRALARGHGDGAEPVGSNRP